MQFETKIPSDIYALKALGVPSWQSHYYWPVSDSEFFSLTEVILSEFDRLYAAQDDAGRALILSDAGFALAFLARHLHAGIAEASCRKKGFRVVWGELAGQFHRPSWEKLSGQFTLRQSAWERWLFHLRRAAKKVKFNRTESLPKRLFQVFREQEVWSLGSFSRLKSDYLESRHIHCDHPYIQTLIPPASLDKGLTVPEDLSDGLRRFLEGVQVHVQGKLDGRLGVAEILKCWASRLAGLRRVYECVRNQPRVPKILLLTECAKPLHKIAAMALRTRGTRVVGFHHGNDMGNAWEKFSAYMETAHCDEFICPTEAAARFHKREYEGSTISLLHPVEFSAVETPYYRELFLKAQATRFPKKIESVMLMGYPMNAYRYLDSPADFFLFQLDLELRLSKLLKQKGFRVIYKMHPEHRSEAAGLFESLVDEVLTQPFEKVWQRADAYFFGCTTSTTFGFALCLNKPVFVLEIEGKKWNPEAYEKLRGRCVMIPARCDDRSRLEFDEELILEEMSREQKRPDFSYVKEFMFPRASGS